MPFFSDSEEVRVVMEELWTRIGSASEISIPLLKSQLVVRFHYREPEGRLTVDSSNGESLQITWGECEKKPVVEMFMKADVAHEFWQGKVNVPVYLISGRIVAKGPVNKALTLLPVIKPAFQIYPAVVNDTLGRPLAAVDA